MKLLLTSAGISNRAISEALVGLLGRPVDECDALVVPAGIYPFPGGAQMAADLVRGVSPSPLCGLGWKSLGLLELSVLPSIDTEVWTSAVRDADALLVWGGDVVFLCHWMRQSGLADLLGGLPPELVYVGVSAGSIIAATAYGETYDEPPREPRDGITSAPITFDGPEGEVARTLVSGPGLGLVDFAVIPHLDHPDHPDASSSNAQRWAARIPGPTYAIDDQSAITVVDGVVEVVSEGHWTQYPA